VDFDTYLDQCRRQAQAMRSAAEVAGPDAEVPTTPGWDVRRLVRHIARVHNQVLLALDSDPAGSAPRTERPPEDWDTLLTYWDQMLAAMLDGMRRRGPDAPAWAFRPNGTAGFWARRQAHEIAVHRLDAEHAAGTVEHLVFDPGFAADGIDEALSLSFDRPVDVAGTVLYHAADAGRAWLATLTPGKPPVIGPATEIETDASVVGTADAVYRAVWGRPSTAVVGGDPTLAAALRTP
jgi:uncharacterized protein (TIGR03083 family)